MNRFKFEAFKKEFPFLREILGDVSPLEIDEIKIKRADENLLTYIPCDSSHVGSLGRTKSEVKIHFVLNNGEIIQEAVIPEKSYSSNYSGDTPFEKEGETVLEAIDRHGVAESLAFIVAEKYYLDDYSLREPGVDLRKFLDLEDFEVIKDECDYSEENRIAGIKKWPVERRG